MYVNQYIIIHGMMQVEISGNAKFLPFAQICISIRGYISDFYSPVAENCRKRVQNAVQILSFFLHFT